MEDSPGTLLLSDADARLVGIPTGPFSPTLLDHAARPRNMGRLDNPHASATATGICEDTITVQLRHRAERIEDIRFTVDGCGFTRACASIATVLARGKTLQQALQIDGERIIHALEGVPREHTHCAHLAAAALGQAVRKALDRRAGSEDAP